MQIEIYPDYPGLCRAIADRIAAVVQARPEALLCITSGDSPRGVCACMVEDARAGRVDFSRCTVVALDEWAGMDRHVVGSCQHFLYENLFEPLGLRPEQIVCFDAKAADLEADCQKINALVAARGGFDLMLVGLGMNGHIGMNEPGTPFDSLAHVADLDETTRSVGQKYFPGPTPLSQGITLGLGHFQAARRPILMANGERKAAIVRTVLHGPVTESIPASVVQTIDNALVMLDSAAAGT